MRRTKLNRTTRLVIVAIVVMIVIPALLRIR